MASHVIIGDKSRPLENLVEEMWIVP